jgi:hypothetical protein
MSNESFSLAMMRRGDGNIGDPTAVAFVTDRHGFLDLEI